MILDKINISLFILLFLVWISLGYLYRTNQIENIASWIYPKIYNDFYDNVIKEGEYIPDFKKRACIPLGSDKPIYSCNIKGKMSLCVNQGKKICKEMFSACIVSDNCQNIQLARDYA